MADRTTSKGAAMYTAIDPQPQRGNVAAKPDQVWVCSACGKTARSRYGFDDDGTTRGGACNADRGWDTSCTMHAVLCKKETK